jgi:uncharacterized protein (DUF362 family)
MHPRKITNSTKRISRRELLKTFAVLAGGVALNQLDRGIFNTAAKSEQLLLDTQIYIPVTAKYHYNYVGKVVQVQSHDATSWNGKDNYYWKFVDQVELTNAATVTDAWRALIQYYQPGEKIAIKVNFNNCWSCSNESNVIDALIQPVNAVVDGLEQIGVKRSDVWVFDAVRALPQRFVLAGLPGIRFFDRTCNIKAGFNSVPDAFIDFAPPPGMSMPAEKVTEVVRNATYLINMPIMKGGHPLAGVTLGFKNHFGTIDHCNGLHDYVDVVHKPPRYNPAYNPMVDFFTNQHIGGKTVLTIGDAIFAARDFNDPPEPWTTFGHKVPHSLFFATDPVSIDCVMHDFIQAELGDKLATGANRYLAHAGRAGIGIYETANPWTDSYMMIDYNKIEI